MNRTTRSSVDRDMGTPKRAGHSRMKSVDGLSRPPLIDLKRVTRSRSSVPLQTSVALNDITTTVGGRTRASHAGVMPVIQQETLDVIVDAESPNGGVDMTSTSSPATVRLASRIQPRRPPKLRQSLIRNPPLKMEDRAEGLEKYAQQCISSQINSVLKDGVQEINYDQMVRDLELLDGEMRLFVVHTRDVDADVVK